MEEPKNWRAYDIITEWMGEPRSTYAEALQDVKTHNHGCAMQGGYGMAIVAKNKDGLLTDDGGYWIYPPQGQVLGAVRWL